MLTIASVFLNFFIFIFALEIFCIDKLPDRIYNNGSLEEDIKMDISKTIKRMILEKDIKQGDIAARLNMSRSMFNQVINRPDLRINTDLIPIASAIGYDVKIQLIDQVNGKIIEVD